MPAGVYLHIPFCKSRCSYCDFATDVYRNAGVVERYVEALVKEIKMSVPPAVAGGSNKPPEGGTQNGIDTIYLGGGTPSLLSPDQARRVLDTVKGVFDIASDTEITMEMNPATVTPESLAGYRSMGVNRASFGVQTFDDRALKLLARGHDANDARVTFRLLRDAGFDNISFDLIAGLPGQTLDEWKRNLDEAIAMEPEHVSLYLLEVHESTPLAEQIRSGRRPMPDEQLAAEMYELMLERLFAADYEQYEISNFAKPGFESRHNTKYWRMDPVFGFGVSVHSFDGRERNANERDTAKYVEQIETSGSAENFREQVDLVSETAFLGLRMTSGIDVVDLEKRFGVDLIERYCAELDELSTAGLVLSEENHLRLTPKGMLYSNEVFRVFV